ncbi:MAG: GxxExxY protein [Candidatus Komeilibacteria bacterium]|nr:GxxExxY protein [Candidatus Komeilibacteria bacterium]
MKSDLIYADFCYRIVGILFEVYNNLGYGYQEKYYQKAVAVSLENNKINFKEQVKVILKLKGAYVGKYFLDFLIDDKIILELKKGNYFSRKNIEQVYAYLKSTNLKLGILANFTSTGIKFKRIVNIK